MEYSKGKSPDLEQLLNKIGSIFKPIEEEAPEDETLQAALTAQFRKSEFQGTQAKNRTGPKYIQNSRPERAEQESDSRLTSRNWNLAQSNVEPLHQCRISILYKIFLNFCPFFQRIFPTFSNP